MSRLKRSGIENVSQPCRIWPDLDRTDETFLGICCDQCDQIGRFLQVLGNKLSHKSFQNIFVSFWAISNNVTVRKSVWLLLGNIRGEVRQLFIPSSGHADLVMSVCSEATFLGQTGDNEIVLSKIFKRGR